MLRPRPSVLHGSNIPKDRSHQPHPSKPGKLHARKTGSRTPSSSHPALYNSLLIRAKTGHSALANPGKTAKLYVLQYYDQSSYEKKMTGLNPSSSSSSIRIADHDPYRVLDMPDPGSYAIYIEISPTKTFLYIPETNNPTSASSGPGEPSSYSIACHTNTRPERKGVLIEGFTGHRDIRVEDVEKVRGVVGDLKMEKGMESFDWAYRVLTVCEERGLLRGSVSTRL